MRRLVTCMVLAVSVGLALIPTADAWSWPLQGDLLRPFALGSDPYAGGQHRGVDVAGAAGEDVRAPAGGTVTFAGSVPTHGRVVTIHTSDGYAVTLAHLGELAVAKGALVAEGDRVGEAGASGTPEHEGAYVHLGIRVAAQEHGYVDPLSFLPSRPMVVGSAPASSRAPAGQQAPAMPPAAAEAPTPSSAPVPSSSAASQTATGSGDPRQAVARPEQPAVPTPGSTTATAPTAPAAPGGGAPGTTVTSTALELDGTLRRTAPAAGAPSGGGQPHAGRAPTPGVAAAATHGSASPSHAQPADDPVASDAAARLLPPAAVLAVDRGGGSPREVVGHADASAVATGPREARAASAARHAPRVASPGAKHEHPRVAAPPTLPGTPSADLRGAPEPLRAASSDGVLDDGIVAEAGGEVGVGDRSAAWLVGAGALALTLALVGLVVAVRRAATTPVSLRRGAWARA